MGVKPDAFLICKVVLLSITDKKVKNYIYLSEEELDTYLQWDGNETAVYLYLKFRCGDDDCIQTSRESIMKTTGISHATVTKAVQALENRKLILVKRKEEQHHLVKEQRESNIYILLDRQVFLNRRLFLFCSSPILYLIYSLIRPYMDIFDKGRLQ